MKRAFLAFALFACLGSFASSTSAQDTDAVEEREGPGDSRAASFRAVSGPQAERVPGGTLTVVAYGGAWALLLGYLWRLGRMHTQNERELSALRKSLDTKAP